MTHFLNKLNEEHFTFHLQYKYSDTFVNRKYEQLSYPKNPKMWDPILVTLLKMRPHYSQSSRENATPFSGTSPLASYKEVPPPPRGYRPLPAGCKSLSVSDLRRDLRYMFVTFLFILDY